MSREAERGDLWCSTHFAILIWSGTPVYWAVLPTLKVGLLFSVKPLWKHSQTLLEAHLRGDSKYCESDSEDQPTQKHPA